MVLYKIFNQTKREHINTNRMLKDTFDYVVGNLSHFDVPFHIEILNIVRIRLVYGNGTAKFT